MKGIDILLFIFFGYSLILFYVLYSLLSSVIKEKEKDGISSPSSLVAFEEKEISSLRRPTLVRHHIVALRSATGIPHVAVIHPTTLYPVATTDHAGNNLTVAAQQADSR